MADRLYWSELERSFIRDSWPGAVERAFEGAGIVTFPLIFIRKNEDWINTGVSDTDPGRTEFQLATAQPMWWKSLSLHQWDEGPVVASCETQDERTVAPALSFRSADIAPYWLVLSKAKFLGVHTDMYKIPMQELNRGDFYGKRFSFLWERD